MRTYNFQPHGMFSDWRFTFAAADVTTWDPAVEEVILGMTPDNVEWDDYGLRSISFAPDRSLSALSSWSSRGSDLVVTLSAPNVIDIQVPGSQLSRLGPGVVNLGIRYQRDDTGERQTLVTGRLPLLNTVV